MLAKLENSSSETTIFYERNTTLLKINLSKHKNIDTATFVEMTL